MAIEPISGWTVTLILVMFFFFYLTAYFWSMWREKEKQFEERMKRLETKLEDEQAARRNNDYTFFKRNNCHILSILPNSKISFCK